MKSGWSRALLPWVAAVALQVVALLAPGAVERLYARGLYPRLSAGLAQLNGWTRLSLAEFVLGTAALVLAGCAVRGLWALGRRGGRARALGLGLRRALALGGWLYLAFLVLWGLNYHRRPFVELAGYDRAQPTPTELAALCSELLEETNRLRATLAEDLDGVARLAPGRPPIFERVAPGYERASAELPWLEPTGAIPKGVGLPVLMSLLGISGIYFPFTGEPNVNSALPAFQLPFTASHELAHQLGVAREDEANFAAYLACSAHPDGDFRYSGSLAALRHGLFALALVDPEAFEVLRAGLAPGVLRDLEAVAAFWERWSSPLRGLSRGVNDLYLKAHGQLEGIESYGRMVDLLIARRRR